MPRKDYDEIKSKYAEYIKTWINKDSSQLYKYVCENVKTKFSVAQNLKSNDYDGLLGVKRFVETFPKTDIFHPAIYNYICRIHKNEAQQYAIVPCVALNYVEGQYDLDCFYFTVQSCNHWVKTADGWKMSSMKSDLEIHYGDLQNYFAKTWHFEKPLADYEEGVHLPCIQGEIDSPWIVIPEAEDVLCDEEKIIENGAQYAFGVDHIVFDHSIATFTRKYNVYAEYGKNEGTENLMAERKYKRQKDRYWVHPVKYLDIKIDGDRAYTTFYRVTGYRQRNHEYVWNRDNVDIEHMCQVCYKELVKEDGQWKTAYERFDLGLYESGPYADGLYGDIQYTV